MPAQQILAAQPILTGQPTAEGPSDLAPPPTVPLSPATPLVSTNDDQPQPAPVLPAETPVASFPKPERNLALVESLHPVTPVKIPRGAQPAETITQPVGGSAAVSQLSSTVAPQSTAAPAPILARPSVATATLASQDTARHISAAAQAVDQPTAQSTAISQPAMTAAPMAVGSGPPQLQAFSNQVSSRHPLEEQAASQQILPGQYAPNQADAAPPSPLPARHATNISTAESAWQTRLQVSLPTKPQPKPRDAPDQMLLAVTPPTADSPAPEILATEPDSSDAKASTRPLPLAALAPLPQAADIAKPRVLIADTAPPPQPAPPVSARRTSAMAEKPTADAAATPIAPAVVPDQPSRDQGNAQANPVVAGPITPHQTVATQALPPPLPAVPAQLIRHLAAAQTGAVDVLLQPEELGHVKFQIQQQGDSVRILLSAERPETLDLLRRHSDQLLQEFRQSGFSQASLSFGQWDQQQRSPAPPPELVAQFDADFVEAPAAPRPPPVAVNATSGQGLNLRL